MEEAKEILFTAIEHGRTSIIQAIVNKIQTSMVYLYFVLFTLSPRVLYSYTRSGCC